MKVDSCEQNRVRDGVSFARNEMLCWCLPIIGTISYRSTLRQSAQCTPACSTFSLSKWHLGLQRGNRSRRTILFHRRSRCDIPSNKPVNDALGIQSAFVSLGERECSGRCGIRESGCRCRMGMANIRERDVYRWLKGKAVQTLVSEGDCTEESVSY